MFDIFGSKSTFRYINFFCRPKIDPIIKPEDSREVDTDGNLFEEYYDNVEGLVYYLQIRIFKLIMLILTNIRTVFCASLYLFLPEEIVH